MFANVTFLRTGAETLPVVPTSALVLKDERNQVFVEIAPWMFEARDVDIGFQQGDQAVLTQRRQGRRARRRQGRSAAQ